jgi:DNA-binding MarR family transcriptional regulator
VDRGDRADAGDGARLLSRAEPPETGEDRAAGETPAALAPFTGYRLRRLQGLFVTHWGRWYRERDIAITPVQGGIVLLIGENAGLTQIALARLLKVEPPTLLQSLTPLVEAGYVARSRSERDGRAFALSLTGKGRDIAGVIAEESRKHEADLLAGLSDQERADLLRLLDKALASGEAALEGED